jgi:hypothetical protein
MQKMADITVTNLPEIHPEWLALTARIARLREGIAVLLDDESRLLLQEQPVLIAEYEMRLGALDLELLMLEAESAELRFRVERLNALLNRGEAITPERLEQIEDAVAAEHALWAARLAQREADLALGLAVWRSLTSVDAEVQRRCKTAYRRLVRLLHPDVTQNPEASKRFWQIVQDAYRDWDAERLESLLVVMQVEIGAVLDTTLGLVGLEAEVARLEAQTDRLAGRQRELLTQIPFCYRELLRDPVRIESLRGERLTAIEQAKVWRDYLHALLQSFLERASATLH